MVKETKDFNRTVLRIPLFLCEADSVGLALATMDLALVHQEQYSRAEVMHEDPGSTLM